MRRLLAGLAACVALVPAGAAHAQQGSLQLSAAAQTLTGEPDRLTGQNTLEPDVGVLWLQPGARFGLFELELRGTSRSGRPHVGRTHAALRDARFGGFSWTFEGGDSYLAPAIGDYRFSNLVTPAATFNGGAVSARSERTSFSLGGGRATALRNIFGSDPDGLGQLLAAARLSHRAADRVELTARASRIRTSSLGEFDYTTTASDQAGAGMRLRLTSAIELVADGGVVSYRRPGAARRERDGSALVGTNWLLARGWLQVNASRFPAGDFPVLNNSLQDRDGLFAAGEYDLWPRVRAFGGWDAFRTNLHPDASAASERPRPEGSGTRGFAGLRLQLSARSTVTVRAEDGARVSRPVGPGGLDRESDTGSWGTEWQATFGRVTSFARYARRENVDRRSLDATFSQQDAFAQLFFNLSRSTQLFGLASIAENTNGAGGGSTYWQAGGGAQLQPFDRSLWVRLEGTASGNVDLLSDSFVPRHSIGFGVNGQLNARTSIGFNLFADRAPLETLSGSPWLTRSTFRLVQTLPTGRVRVASAAPGLRRSRATASVTGSVFADWNGDGLQDPDDGPLENIPLRLGGEGARSSRDGGFAFLNVPAGLQEVGVDVAAVPVDFDPPAVTKVQLELSPNETRKLAFGLVPLGTVRGRVQRDDNNSGAADAGDAPVDGAVVVLDGGARSEQVREGRFRFDAVRSGAHVVELLAESLPDGSALRGEAAVAVALVRERMIAEVTFLVSAEKRQEIRRVFPAAGAGGGAAPAPVARPPGAAAGRAAAATAGPATGQGSRNTTPAARASGAPPQRPAARTPAGDPDAVHYAVQVAALRNWSRAKSLVSELLTAGFPAFLVEPDNGDGLFRIRVGSYRTRAAAQRAAGELARRGGETPWIVPGVRER